MIFLIKMIPEKDTIYFDIRDEALKLARQLIIVK